jgi:hypothetical protein
VEEMAQIFYLAQTCIQPSFDCFPAETPGQSLDISDPVSSAGNMGIGFFTDLLGNV